MEIKVDENGRPIYYVTDNLVEVEKGVSIPFYKALEDKETGNVIINTANNDGFSIITFNAGNVNPNLNYEIHGTSAVSVNTNMSIKCYDNSYVRIFADCNVSAFDNAYVKDFENSSISLHNNAKAMCLDASKIEAYDNSEVIMLGEEATIAVHNNSIAVIFKDVTYSNSDNARIIDMRKEASSMASIIAYEAENAIHSTINSLAKNDRSLNIGDSIKGIPETLSKGYDRSLIYTCFFNDLNDNNGVHLQLVFELMKWNIEHYTNEVSFYRIYDVCTDIADFRSVTVHDEYKKNIFKNIDICRNITPDGDSIIYNSEDRTISILRYNIKADMREYFFTDIPSIKGAITCRTLTIKDIEKACSEKKNYEDVANYLSVSGKSKSSCPYYSNFASYAERYNPSAKFSAPHIKITDYSKQAKDFIKFIDNNIKFPTSIYKTITNEMKRICGVNSKYSHSLAEKKNLYLLTAENLNTDMMIEYHLIKYIEQDNDYDYLEDYGFSERLIEDVLDNLSINDEYSLFSNIFEYTSPVKTYMYKEEFGNKANCFLNPNDISANIVYTFSEIGKDKLLKFIDETNRISLVLPFKTED